MFLSSIPEVSAGVVALLICGTFAKLPKLHNKSQNYFMWWGGGSLRLTNGDTGNLVSTIYEVLLRLGTGENFIDC